MESVPVVSHFFPVCNYALEETLRSGQAFRWRPIEGGWESVVDGHWVRLKQTGAGIQAEATQGSAGDWQWLREYLQVEVDYRAVVETLESDPHLKPAIKACPGLRLLRQPLWECLASFILSSTKQIVQIEKIVETLCSRFGERVPVPSGHDPVFAFPSAAVIAGCSEKELRECKMGFRAPYLKATAERVASGEADLEQLRSLRLDEAREKLMELPGVGRKIADCVLLFGYGFQTAFPVDVWVLRGLREFYPPFKRKSMKRILQLTQTRFGPYAGYAQQFLFHYMRTRIGRRNQ